MLLGFVLSISIEFLQFLESLAGRWGRITRCSIDVWILLLRKLIE